MRRPRLRHLRLEPPQLDRHRRDQPIDLDPLPLELALPDDPTHVCLQQPPPLPLQLRDPRPQPLDHRVPIIRLGLQRRLGRVPCINARNRPQQRLGDRCMHILDRHHEPVAWLLAMLGHSAAIRPGAPIAPPLVDLAPHPVLLAIDDRVHALYASSAHQRVAQQVRVITSAPPLPLVLALPLREPRVDEGAELIIDQGWIEHRDPPTAKV